MTAETLVRRSPLAGYADRLAATALDVVEEPFATHLLVRTDARGATAAAVERQLGLSLPDTGRRTGDADRAVLWLGPDEWLVTDHTTARDLPNLAATGATLTDVTLTDVSDQRTTLRLRGPLVRAVLAKGLALDLHPRVLAADLVAQVLLAQVPLVLVVLDPGPADGGVDADLDLRLLVRASFARHVADWLLDAALEHGSR